MAEKKNPHAVALGKRGGRVKSAKKAEACRANGKLGGHWSLFKKAKDAQAGTS